MKADLIIIGSGPGGYETAAYAAKHGLQVVIIEEKQAGGTCLNCGCIPTKALVHDAESAIGKNDGALRYHTAIQRKNTIVNNLRQGVEARMQQSNITLVYGHATFSGAHTVAVGDESFEADNIIIATGSTAKLPSIPGLGADGKPISDAVVTSEQLLVRATLPTSLCIVGAGVIGMEMASIFSAFGCKVTVVEALKECLPTMDAEIARRLRKMMEKQNILFHLDTAVQRIENHNVVLKDLKKDTDTVIEAEAILIATGRKAYIDGLHLETAGIEIGSNGILTNDNLQTNQPHIYAIGDVNGRQMLAHAASFQGFHAVNHILNKHDNIRLNIMPSAVFTHPEAASVGPTEAQCKADRRSYYSLKAIYRANGRAQAMEQTEGLIKLILDERDTIIACHALGADAASIVQEVSSLMNFGITRSQMADIIHIHPTLNEILLDAVRA